MSTLRSLALSLWFIGYFIWIQPAVLERLAQAPEQKNFALGFFLIAIQVLEVAGFWLKFPAVSARIEANRSQSWVQLATILLVMTHLMITALLAFTTNKLLGIDINSDGLRNGLVGFALFFAALGKEGLFLGWWFQLMGAKDYKFPAIPTAITPHTAEIIGDGLLAIFSALAYTVVWEQTAADSFIISSTTARMVLEYFGAGLFFLMVFPATRSLYYTEELLTQRPRPAVLAAWALFLVTMTAALAAIPKT